MVGELPRGWARTTLGEITTPSRERVLPTENTNLPYIGLENVESQTMKLLGHGYAREARSSSMRFSKGDVLYGKMRPYLNKVWVADSDGLCSSEFLVFKKRNGLNSQFLATRLNADDFVTFANSQVSGDRPRVDFDKLSRFTILLPPITEQNRIMIKLNAALSALLRAESAANRAGRRLKEYRDAVLKAAVSGGLTRKWREIQQKGNVKNVETGGVLLQHLLDTRRARWERNELQRLNAAGKEPKDNTWKMRYPEPTPPRLKDLPTIPEGWTWASLDQIGELSRGKSKHRPRGDARLYGGSVPFIQTGDIRKSGGTIREHSQTYNEFGLMQSRLWPAGTLCITIAANIAETGILSYPACFPDSIVGFIQDEALLRVRFIEFFIRSAKDKLDHYAPATAQKNINLGTLAGLAIPLPPYNEQVEIVKKVERRLLASNHLAEMLEQQHTRSRSTRQSLLQEAFNGRLVPQESIDEPASVLLERFRFERISLETKKREAKNRPNRQLKTSVGEAMKKPILTPLALSAAFERIGRKADTDRLFKEVGCNPDEVITFYETLRSTPDVLKAFEKEAGIISRRKSVVSPKNKLKQKGHFRLVEIWLEDFKNLKDYTIRFNSAQGLDVVLGWNGTGKSNLFEVLVIIFRDLYEWSERNRWPEYPMNGYRLSYEIDEKLIEIIWNPSEMKRPMITASSRSEKNNRFDKPKEINSALLPLPHFVFGYYSGPTNRLAEHFQSMNQSHYVRLREATSDDSRTLAALLEQRRFFCAETHHAKYVLLAFFYREDPEIRNFLRDRLRIIGFDSALFIIRKPRWARQGAKASDFWGAKGVMRRVLERLRDFAIAPMVIEQTVNDGYRTSKEDHYYFFLPDLLRLQLFAAEYDDARTFFLALESTDFSELIHDVKIQVRVNATKTEEIPITFREMSEGEQQLLMVLGLMRFTKSFQSLVLLDEPDTHLNPQWSVDYLKLLTKLMSDDNIKSDEQQTSQILISTHDPLVIASLVKEQIHLLKRDIETGACKWVPATVNPRGLGYTGILTSEMFGFRSDLDEETLADLDNKVRLLAKEGELSSSDKKKLELIDQRLEETGFQKAFSDPYYAAFVRAWGRNYNELMAGQQILSLVQMEEIERVADKVLEEARAEVDNKAADL